jgi:hypothetical protein
MPLRAALPRHKSPRNHPLTLDPRQAPARLLVMKFLALALFTLASTTAFALESYTAVDELELDVEAKAETPSKKDAWIQAVFQGHNPAQDQFMAGIGALIPLTQGHILGARALKGPGSTAASALYQYDINAGGIARSYLEPSASYYDVATRSGKRHLPSLGLSVGADVRLFDSISTGVSLGIEAYRADSSLSAAFKNKSLYLSPKGMFALSAGF